MTNTNKPDPALDDVKKRVAQIRSENESKPADPIPTTEKELTPEEKAQLEEQARKNKELLNFLDLDSSGPQTIFFDVDYAGKNGMGRTVIALGHFAMHVRTLGNKKGKFWNESLGINVEGEQDYDVMISVLRHHISSLILVKRKKGPDEIDELDQLIEGEDTSKSEIASLFIHYLDGHFEINNITVPMAKHFRKMIYSWMTNFQY